MLFRKNRNERKFSYHEIREALRSNDPSKRDKIKSKLAIQYKKLLSIEHKSFKKIEVVIDGQRLFDEALNEFYGKITADDYRLSKFSNLEKEFVVTFDNFFLNKFENLHELDKKKVLPYLKFRIWTALKIRKKELRIKSLSSSRMSVFEEAFSDFEKAIFEKGFKLSSNLSLKDVFEKTLDKIFVKILFSTTASKRIKELIWEYLYDYFKQLPRIAYLSKEANAIIIKTKADSSEFNIETVFDDSFLALLSQVISGQFKADSKLSVYFISIYKYKIFDLYRILPTNDKEELPVIEELNEDFPIIKNPIIYDSEDNLVSETLNMLSKKCEEILKIFISRNLKHIDAASELRISIPTFKKRLTNCMEEFKIKYRSLL